MDSNIQFALFLTIISGFSTMIGGVLVFWIKHTSEKIIAFGTGLSAGIMTYMSFFELLPESFVELEYAGAINPKNVIITAFITGLVIAYLIDAITHKAMDKKDLPCLDGDCNTHHHKALMKTGIFTALALGIHNIPEGIITFATSMVDRVFGVSVAIAVAIHNIPEGLCIALPLYCATRSRKKSLWYVFVASLAEPVGAIMMYLILQKFINQFVIGIMLAGVAGVMVYVSFDELLPISRRMGRTRIGLAGLVCGMGIMPVILGIYG